MKIKRLSYRVYSDKEKNSGNDSWKNTLINNPEKALSNQSNAILSVKAETAMKAAQAEAIQRSKTMAKMTENSTRLRTAQLKKQASDQRFLQNNRRLEVRKDEAAARVAVQNKKTEASIERIKRISSGQFKSPTKVNTPVTSNK